MLDVVAIDLNLVFGVFGLQDLGVTDHCDFTAALLAQEILNADVVVAFDDAIDGEVSVDEAHLVLETAGDTSDHVVQVSADGVHSGLLLGLGVPDLHSHNIRILVVLDNQGTRTEGTLKDTAWAFDSDDALVHCALHGLRNLHLLCDEAELHFEKERC